MELLEVIVDHLTEGALGAVGLALAGLVVFVVIRVIDRDKLVIEKFTSDDSSLAQEFASFDRLVGSEIRTVLNTHLAQQEAAGDLRIYAELAPESRADEIALELAPARWHPVLRPVLSLIGWLTPPPTLRGLVDRGGDAITVRATVYRRSQAPQELEKVSRPSSTANRKAEMAKELGLKVIVQQSKPHISVSDWRALDCITRAIAQWPQSLTQAPESDPQARFKVAEDSLLDAQKHDPQSSLVNYNLGLLYYYRYTREYNMKARTLLEKAERSHSIRLRALAKKGIARCYCQDYHRFGKETPGDLSEARRAAAEAVKLIEQARQGAKGHYARHLKIDMARALYCRAFAQHVTESPEDIESAINDYLLAIEETKPQVPAVIYNNLGYILMARAGRIAAGSNRSDYEEARRYFQKALQADHTYKFALANLGNVERLLGNVERAIQHYLEALETDPKYANGWNGLAWVYVENDQPNEAADAHQKALGFAGDDEHRSEVKEHYARVLHSVGRPQEALVAAREGRALNPNNTTLNKWLLEIGESPAGPRPS